MRKLPNGISNYEDIVNENRIYIDKTMYIEKMENLADKAIMFLRPRKFGKTLFISTLECYYDLKKENQFDKLFTNTYIGKNPTPNKNRYHILRFNFSGIDTSSLDSALYGFKNEIASSIKVFVGKYNLDFFVNTNDEPEYILDNLFKSFYLQKNNEKIYVIIDEYDHFANELLGFRTDEFKNLLSKNGKIRKWYEILKKGTESVIDRIFITGVAPITLDSITSGFNIARDITKNINFNDMLGFTKNDVKYLMTELELNESIQEKLLPIIKENYDGYIFSDILKENLEKYRIFNPNMTLFFLTNYLELNEIPNNLVDINILSDYSKIEAFMNLYKDIGKLDILEKLVAGETIESELTEKFNAEISFGERELISLLYYLGYVTIKNNDLGTLQFCVPNDVIRKIYTEYFMKYLDDLAGFSVSLKTLDIKREILFDGKIDKILDVLKQYLTNLSNRDYQRFDEKYIKVIFYSICRMLGSMIVKSELEVGGKYSDILLIPTEKLEERFAVLIEFKYISKEDYEKNNNLLLQKQLEAKTQVEIYKNSEELKLIPNLRCYTIVVIKDNLFVEEIQ